MEFKKINWLSDKYISSYGLRNWTWNVIVGGIIKENILALHSESDYNVDPKMIKLLWKTFLEIADVNDLNRIPNTNDFEGPDVKAAMYMYSMESFLYKRINRVAIDKNYQSVKSLGPFSVLISKIIEKSRKTEHSIQGPFMVYRGLSLNPTTILEWQ